MRGLASIAFLLTGCVSVEWQRDHQLRPPTDEVLAALAPEEMELAECLELLGAPLLVWEEPAGAALAWGWFEGRTLGGKLSIPVAEGFSASFNGRNVDLDMQGLLLLFDREWNLRLVRRGRLRELATYGRQSPALVESE